MNYYILISCEHSSNSIPQAYQKLFSPYTDELNSHLGYDPGALILAEKLTDNIADFSQFATTSRLLVELNRSLHHPRLFSFVTNRLDKQAKQEILQSYYFPYRQAIEQQIEAVIQQGQPVLHISVHSFTSILNNIVRHCDIGFLFDSRRKSERAFCQRWKENLVKTNPSLTIRFNYPYLGTMDGFTTYLRKKFPEERYIGIELEVNQKHYLAGGKEWEMLQTCLLQTLKDI